MNRRAFLWMALGTLAGTGCVSRTQSGVGTTDSGLPPTDAGAAYSPNSSSEAKEIFKEFTDATWDAPSPLHAEDVAEDTEESRWLSNAATEVSGDSAAQPPAAPETGTVPAHGAQKGRLAAKPAEKTAPAAPKQSA